MNKLRVLDLFSGIGGFSLGLERTGGFETVAFCEIEEFPRRVLAKHWPEVPCYNDVRTLTAATLAADGVNPNVICGGFPCQDISTAGLGAGLDGARSGLWSEFARLIGEIRPKFVIVENVAALLGRGLGRVLADLAKIRYDAEWHCIPASAFGAPHQRDRIWIIAYESERYSNNPFAPDTNDRNEIQMDANIGRMGRIVKSIQRDRDWKITSEPVLGRGTNGIPHRVDRCGSLGNAVIPQIPEMLGRAILAAEGI